MTGRSGRVTGWAAILAVGALTAACSGADGDPRGPGAASSRSGSAAATGPATSAPGTTGSGTPTTEPGGPFTMAFGGDVHFAEQLAPLAENPDSLAELMPYLGAADLAMVNLESAITERGSPEPKKFHFRTSPRALRALSGAGVDVVTMANNHAVDYGPDGLADTLAAAADSPIPVVGIGPDAAGAYAPAVLTVKGHRVAVFGATQVPDLTLAKWSAGADRGGVASAATPTRLAAAITKVRGSVDVVVVYLHWGTDYTPCPNPLQRSTAEALTAAGADVVVGTHAHQLQGSGWLGKAYVNYGLGNFVWWRRNNEIESSSGVLTLTLDGRRVSQAAWTPLRVSGDGIPREPDQAAERDRMRTAWERGRGCAGLAVTPPS